MPQLVEQPHRITVSGPQLRADRQGYVLDDEWVDGFADRADMAEPERQLIARWARAFTPDSLTPEQRELLAVDRPAPTVERELAGAAIRNAEEDMPSAVDCGLYGRLSADEITKVREPWSV